MALAAVSWLVFAPRAVATSQPAVTVAEGKNVDQAFPPIVGSDPSRPTVQTPPTPEGCATSASCDVVPLKITVPQGIKSTDEFFVTVELWWETDEVEGQHVDELDLYVYEPGGAKPLVVSNGADLPERVRLFNPTKGTYSLVVNNWGGPNTGYTIKATMRVDRIVPPNESTDVVARPGASVPGSSGSAGAPASSGLADGTSSSPYGTSAGAATATASGEPLPPSVELAGPPLDVDPELGNLASGALGTELKSQGIFAKKQTAAIKPAKKVPGIVGFLWLVALPLALAGAGTLLLARRQRRTLRVSTA